MLPFCSCSAWRVNRVFPCIVWRSMLGYVERGQRVVGGLKMGGGVLLGQHQVALHWAHWRPMNSEAHYIAWPWHPKRKATARRVAVEGSSQSLAKLARAARQEGCGACGR